MKEKLIALLIGILLGVAAIAAAFRKGESKGEAEAKAAAQDETLKNITEAKEVQDAVRATTDDAVANELRDNWTRD